MTATVEQVTTPAPTPCPLRLEPASAFEMLRAFLRESAFDEDEICRRLDIASLDRFRAIRDGRPDVAPADSLDVLIRLFLDNEPMTWSETRALVGDAVVDAMQALGLIRDHREDSTRVVANVLLYPTESLFIASDVAVLPEGDPARWWDLVYAAITTNTQNFLSTMPRRPCATFLDLCSGTGVAALKAAATFAEHAWAVDVAERSSEFARFNARLNGIENVTVLTGDLYAPIESQTFDCIVAHPPYVPSRETRMVYRDGGADGEEITRRIIGGLATHLNPGGRFHCTCTATDRKTAPLEQRLRTMLGPRADEFDVAVVVRNEFDPTEYYVRLAIAGRSTWPEAEEWHHHFAALAVTKMVYATIAIVRQRRRHEPFTIRRRTGSATGAREMDRLVRAAEESSSADTFARLIASRPVLASHVTLQSEHSREDGGWAVRSCLLASDVPFDVRLPCPVDLIAMVGQLDGSRTVAELHAELATSGASSHETIDRLASFMHILAAHGFVELHEPVSA